jgi:hypothetical protein
LKRLPAILLLFAVAPAFAHEVRPAYLEMVEESPGFFAVLWKTPTRGDARLALDPQFSGSGEPLGPPQMRLTPDAAIQTWKIDFVQPLRGQTVRIRGLEGTMTDALVRVGFLDGTGWTCRLTPGEPAAQIPEHPTVAGVSGVYFKLGVEQILLGYDHLLFVLALLIITRGGWKIVKTVTAFTVSHCVTL